MSKEEKAIMRKVKKAIPIMTEFQKGYFSGMADALEAKKEVEVEHESAEIAEHLHV